MARSIYIHLPFCVTKCPYCDFASWTNDGEERSQYLAALNTEIDSRMRAWQHDRPRIDTIFFGGGTPSVHSAEELEAIFSKLREHFDISAEVEITLEANPGTIDASKLKSFRDIGINRISIGAQSFDAPVLEKLGRGHSLEDTYQAIRDIKASGFRSWSFDLIYGLPRQSLKSWNETLDIALSFEPPHVSAYALSIEPNTPYGGIYQNSQHPDLPVEDEVISMYTEAQTKFKQAGLLRYEISNWAKPGHEAQHNLTYWKAEEYYAFGVSAHGFVDLVRYQNTRNLEQYLKASPALEENIDAETQIEERIMLGLRLDQGLDLTAEVERGINVDKLNSLIQQGLIEGSVDSNIKLTDAGILVSNKVIAELLCD